MMPPGGHLLVLGGRRSGKSRFAEGVATASGLALVYIATAEPGDAEMAERIAAHRARRGDGWHTVEVPIELPAGLAAATGEDRIVLVDCLTLWLANLMQAERDVDAAVDSLLAALDSAASPVILVSNEVGAGIVPINALARRYADAQGFLNQRVAASVDRVVLMTAGIPLQIKPFAPHQVLS
jgi:adenosylcobinamide kinase / adenosylcobinamide-phosphate guanylyltransferase